MAQHDQSPNFFWLELATEALQQFWMVCVEAGPLMNLRNTYPMVTKGSQARTNLEDTSQGLGQRALRGGMGLDDGWEGWHYCSNMCIEFNSAQHPQTLDFSLGLTCRPHGQPCQPSMREHASPKSTWVHLHRTVQCHTKILEVQELAEAALKPC